MHFRSLPIIREINIKHSDLRITLKALHIYMIHVPVQNALLLAFNKAVMAKVFISKNRVNEENGKCPTINKLTHTKSCDS